MSDKDLKALRRDLEAALRQEDQDAAVAVRKRIAALGAASERRSTRERLGVPEPHREQPEQRRPEPRQGATVPALPAPEASAVRAWAASQGIVVPTRGRLPADVLTAYAQAHSGTG